MNGKFCSGGHLPPAFFLCDQEEGRVQSGSKGDPERRGVNWGQRSGGGVVKPFKRNNACKLLHC